MPSLMTLPQVRKFNDPSSPEYVLLLSSRVRVTIELFFNPRVSSLHTSAGWGYRLQPGWSQPLSINGLRLEPW